MILDFLYMIFIFVEGDPCSIHFLFGGWDITTFGKVCLRCRTDRPGLRRWETKSMDATSDQSQSLTTKGSLVVESSKMTKTHSLLWNDFDMTRMTTTESMFRRIPVDRRKNH